jgi:hypothetical protein
LDLVLDKEEHRDILLALIGKAMFPGEFAESVVELKLAVKTAALEIHAASDDEPPQKK